MMREMSKCAGPQFVRIYWPFWTWMRLWFRKVRTDRKRQPGVLKEPWWQPPHTYYWSRRS